MPEPFRTPSALLRTALFTCIACAVVLCAAPRAEAMEGAPTPQEVRAAFLLNLARFVRWPGAAPTGPARAFVIGYFRSDPIATPLRQIVQGESIGGLPIELLEIGRRDDFNRCNLVYLGTTLNSEVTRAIGRKRDEPVLFVGDNDGLLPAGGHVQFYQQGSQVRLRVSPENLRTAHLVPNSQLLRVATTR